jgi:hypothetical protein
MGGKVTGSNLSYGFRYASGGLVSAFFQDSSEQFATGATTSNDGNWHHYAVTYDRDGLMKVYLDGSLEASTDISPFAVTNFQTSNAFAIGAQQSNGAFPWNGSLDECAVFLKALTASEIAAQVAAR